MSLIIPRTRKSPPAPHSHASLVHAPGGILIAVEPGPVADTLTERLGRWIPQRVQHHDALTGIITVIQPYTILATMIIRATCKHVAELQASGHAKAVELLRQQTAEGRWAA